MSEPAMEAVKVAALNDAMDELSKRILRDTYTIEAADRMAAAVHDYIVAFVKKGPFNCDMEGSNLIKFAHEYRERRGLKP
jgi:hypothetical protein